MVTAISDQPGLDDSPQGVIGPSEVNGRINIDLPYSFHVWLEHPFLSDPFLLKYLVPHIRVLIEEILYNMKGQ